MMTVDLSPIFTENDVLVTDLCEFNNTVFDLSGCIVTRFSSFFCFFLVSEEMFELHL